MYPEIKIIDSVDSKVDFINNVLHWYDGCRDEGDVIVERIATAMCEAGEYGEELDEVAEEVIGHLVEVYKLLKL
jgi:hypothetical protein